MSKQQGDFITYVRNGVAINALVAFSRDVYTPATQTVPASTVEHLTLVYLDPTAASSGIQTGEQLRSSIKVEFSVPPLTEGKVNGWKDLIEPSAGGINLEYATDHIWTMEDKPGFIGLRVDCGDAGTIYFTPDQAEQTIDALKFQMFHLKSSGIDGDAGDWTEAGDGTDYPSAPASNFEATAKTAVALDQHLTRKPFATLTVEEKANTIYPTWDGIVTESGKTQEQLDAEVARQHELETPLTDAEKDELADKASEPIPSVGIGQPAE